MMFNELQNGQWFSFDRGSDPIVKGSLGPDGPHQKISARRYNYHFKRDSRSYVGNVGNVGVKVIPIDRPFWEEAI